MQLIVCNDAQLIKFETNGLRFARRVVASQLSKTININKTSDAN